ncbi:UNVERIFIED_CONTAM: hypothetical protein PYX00_005397 [Menopon gallinae]|uniref:protein-serine/threonine phosphatase n=1 Tax=Menopon gallinae TaxID=328185 RepID=A0AAW2HR98_9NEOP
MALVTVQRSPSVGSSPPSSESGAGTSVDEEDGNRSKSLSECYFAGKGAALVLPPNERVRTNRRLSSSGSDIQQHLQSMFYLLRPEETLKMAVKLESVHSGRTRYLVVVSCIGRQDAEECCLLGIDCNEKTTIGLVLRVLADTTITLDGDGGFSVCVCGRQHIFKPVSVQAMWSALQTLHKVSSKARERNYFLGGLTHDWAGYYEQRIDSDQSCLNEWHAMDNIESRRPPSPDSVRTKPREREETECVIRCTLKEIMMSVDLDEVTSKHIRGQLEEHLDMDLGEFKPFIDEEMLTILGQMDAATEIFEHVYLGSEWNASNHEELQKNGVRHILNVTREIDNFFPGMFNYLNIRVYDDEKTDLLKHWDDTFKYISRARAEGSKVLVHCKMGVSRSASVVIAYAMKAYNWDFKKAYDYVKQKRNCIKPNCSFMSQLETYQGILDAMKNREKLQRSKSETNLKSPCLVPKESSNSARQKTENRIEQSSDCCSFLTVDWAERSGVELSRIGGRPKSWSPDNSTASLLFTRSEPSGPTSVSMEHLISNEKPEDSTTAEATQCEVCPTCRRGIKQEEMPCRECSKVTSTNRNHNSHLRIPCRNGQMYSVSQNRIVYLPGTCYSSKDKSEFVPYVKNRVNELESQSGSSNPEANVTNKKLQSDRKGLVLNLTNQFETSCSKSSSPTEACRPVDVADAKIDGSSLILVKDESWDPGEGKNAWNPTELFDCEKELPESDERRTRRERDPFSDKLDHVFDREERKQNKSVPTVPEEGADGKTTRESPSRQNSWSSYDSAVVLGYPGESREAPSRQSSWGSGDLRCPVGTLPSRNSSWGSYDLKTTVQCNPDEGSSGYTVFQFNKDIPWNPGTVKRTKQKLESKEGPAEEDNSPPRAEISTCNLKLHGPKPYQTPKDLKLSAHPSEFANPGLVHYASSPTLPTRPSVEKRAPGPDKMAISQPNMTLLEEESYSVGRAPLSASAPESYSIREDPFVINTTQCSSVRQQKQVLESLTNPKRCSSVDESVMSNESEVQKSVPGKVQNLKKEFEAKSVIKGDKTIALSNDVSNSESVKQSPEKVRSTPPSPVGNHQTETNHPKDLSVKNLVGKYDSKCSQSNSSKRYFANRKSDQSRVKNSSLLLHNLKNRSAGEKVLVFDGPTPSPSMVVASVVAKATSKKQQGNSHPLAHIAINTNHSKPVYNTIDMYVEHTVFNNFVSPTAASLQDFTHVSLDLFSRPIVSGVLGVECCLVYVTVHTPSNVEKLVWFFDEKNLVVIEDPAGKSSALADRRIKERECGKVASCGRRKLVGGGSLVPAGVGD